MSGDNPYGALVEEHAGSEGRWAFGTGFSEALAGVDTTLPAGVDGADLAVYCQMLGDDALVMAQRLIEWCTGAPELEEEVALANIALDLLGQAQLLLARAGQADGSGRDEDAFAYFRDAARFRNVGLAEAANGDFARSIARLLLFASWRLAVLSRLVDSADPVLAAIAAKAVKELAYHREYAVTWTLRLGDGTAHSRERMAQGIAAVWPLLGELFVPHEVEVRLVKQGAAVDPAQVRGEVADVVEQVLAAATLTPPGPLPDAPAAPGGRDGAHTEELAPLLAEMQQVAREHPGAAW
ncbi:ring-1,2-phenylacetyl-CoA epoxidase subunit PaaC [Spinactinospora alkalitolerans]|uniref:Ring-1,2-phenylacetyl-CoA epoxidase subunit PaaC n=1 Tax=Spinactinospora alkalitolerans TaxID=687207 RepID=A0A852TRY2_9ACTN|nr:1,2-phenylacetyl-CoA epoxidase subunit PaaC [Spinactinospora alkalitolerans]NYE46708.1 ring-1,2-phenylacetyl-CoA epoxidase subunit PaaC [Spinactinospora alkalitolerans]